MGSTFIGTDKLKKTFLGSSKVKKIYLGTDKIFSGTPELYINGVLYTITDEQLEGGYVLEIATLGANIVRFTSFDSASFKMTVAVIGGGGSGGKSYVNVNEYGWFGTVNGAGGGEGGVVSVAEFVPTEETEYSLTVGAGATTLASQGATSTGFGLTSLGGKGGGNGPTSGVGYGAGGSGTGGADGGYGQGWWWDSHPPWGPGEEAYTASASGGANGTLFHGTYYAGGAGGHGARNGDGANGQGQANYGGGGTHDSAGKNGAILLLFENR